MEIIFVYNAKSGLQNAILDSLHKLASPSTYHCNLCDLTYGIFSENKVWKQFRQSFDIKMTFLHTDEFETLYPDVTVQYPIAFIEFEGELTEIISTQEMNNFKTVETLIEHVQLLRYPQLNSLITI